MDGGAVPSRAPRGRRRGLRGRGRRRGAAGDRPGGRAELAIRAVAEEIIAAIRRAVAEQHDIEVYAIRLIKMLSLPRTSSGKVQRHACREAFLAGSLEIVAEWTRQDAPTPSLAPRIGRSHRTIRSRRVAPARPSARRDRGLAGREGRRAARHPARRGRHPQAARRLRHRLAPGRAAGGRARGVARPQARPDTRL